jgi:hypothetical protein
METPPLHQRPTTVHKFAPIVAVVLLASCSPSDEQRAKAKARQAGQELKHDLNQAGKEIKQAGKEIKQGVEKTKRELHEATGDSDRKRP